MSSQYPFAGLIQNPAIPQWLKGVVFFGWPFAFVGGLVAATWLVSHITDLGTAVCVVIVGQFLAVGIIAVARRKLELKDLLVRLLILGWPLLLLVVAGVVWLFRGY